MWIRIRNELILLNILVVILIITIIFFPPGILRIVLALPFLLFFPGYATMAAVFPGKDQIDTIERLALSFGISVAIVPLIGLFFNFTAWGIRLEPVLYSISSLIVVTSTVAWLRRRRLPEPRRFAIEFQFGRSVWPKSKLEATLSVGLIIVIIGGLGMLGYIAVTPKVKEAFTELSVAGLDGRAMNYPVELTKGGKGQVIVTISNRENKAVSYQLEVTIQGLKNNEVGPIELADGEKWQETVSFVLDTVGDNQKVEFQLFKDGKPYRLVYIWINVLSG